MNPESTNYIFPYFWPGSNLLHLRQMMIYLDFYHYLDLFLGFVLVEITAACIVEIQRQKMSL